MSKLPEIKVKIEVIEKLEESKGFLKAKSFKVKFSQCNQSAEATIDYIDRKSKDAVCIVPYETVRSQNVDTTVLYLRSCLRATIELCSKRKEDCEFVQKGMKLNHTGNQWEFPAGMIDGEESVKDAACRELEEELGIYVSPAHIKELGPPIFTSAGLAPEKIYFQLAEVNSKYMKDIATLAGDGSAMEKFGQKATVTISEALELCNNGIISDAKTTVAIYRVAKLFGNNKY